MLRCCTTPLVRMLCAWTPVWIATLISDVRHLSRCRNAKHDSVSLRGLCQRARTCVCHTCACYVCNLSSAYTCSMYVCLSAVQLPLHDVTSETHARASWYRSCVSTSRRLRARSVYCSTARSWHMFSSDPIATFSLVCVCVCVCARARAF